MGRSRNIDKFFDRIETFHFTPEISEELGPLTGSASYVDDRTGDVPGPARDEGDIGCGCVIDASQCLGVFGSSGAVGGAHRVLGHGVIVAWGCRTHPELPDQQIVTQQHAASSPLHDTLRLHQDQ